MSLRAMAALRAEVLSVELFSCLGEERVMIEDWRQDYNEHRPHSALGTMARPASQSATARPATRPRAPATTDASSHVVPRLKWGANAARRRCSRADLTSPSTWRRTRARPRRSVRDVLHTGACGMREKQCSVSEVRCC